MATCPSCGGTGGSYGGYQPCYSCGGSGHGGFTDVRCMACGGSGRSSSRDWNTCFRCYGSGSVADPPRPAQPRPNKPSKPAGKSAGKKGKAASKDDWTGANTGFFIIAYIVSLGYLVSDQGMKDWPPFALALIPAFLVGRFWKQLAVLAIAGILIAAFLRGGG